MSDELIKKVRLNDGVFVELFQQGKRKYAVVTDGTIQYRGEKYKEPNPEDEVIKITYRTYARQNGKAFDYYKVIQDPYKDPWPIRTTYGNGDKSPYYLNNGCKINIQWIGKIPNPAFNPGTYSNPGDAEDVPGSPKRYLSNQIVTSSVDDTENSDTLPKSTWVIEQPFQFNNFSPKMSEPNYRDSSIINHKIVTVNLPEGVKEEGEFLVWTSSGLTYNNKSIPQDKEYEGFVANNVYHSGKPSNQIEYFKADFKDSKIIERVINDFQIKVSQNHGISTYDYNLQLCVPDTVSCSIIEYKSPLQAPNNTTEQAAANDTPASGLSASVSKIKLNIQGLLDSDAPSTGTTSSVFQIKAKTDMPMFTIWAGEIPKTEQIDIFEDLSELDDEYMETGYSGEEERTVKLSVGEGLKSEAEMDADVNDVYAPNDPNKSNTPGAGTGLVSTGTYTSELPTESPKGSGSVKPGFNGVPYYQQFDTRWGNVIYGKAKDGTFIEAKVSPKVKGKWVDVSWNGSTYTILCDHSYGNDGYSSIQGGGCGITSTSMIISYWSTKGKCKPTSPVKIAKLAVENNARPGPTPCNGTQPGGKNGSFGKKIKSTFNIDFDASNSSEAQKLIKKGLPVLYCGTNFSGKNSKGAGSHVYPGHFIVITGYDNGKWRVNDPGGNPDGGGITYFDSFPSGAFWKFIPSDMSV